MKQNKTIFKAVGGAAYSSPECNIISVKAEGMLCQSGQTGDAKFVDPDFNQDNIYVW